jgi:2,4-dienoyl-CoA reductase-like NADH-dependent reductase (Old Yellow Enzyme family)
MTMLFEPYDLGDRRLANRVVMAPMTRARAPQEIPDAQTALYYRQRAGAGLIVTEGLPVSEEARGYLYVPGIFNDAQQAGWTQVTDAVHAEGGRIFAQLWHVGRVSHVSLQPGGAAPVSPTGQAAAGVTAFTIGDDGKPGPVPVSTPRALSTDDVARVAADFVRAARRAIDAGFDGIEIHGANGYLFEQLINGALNDRDDRYGGSVENRLRFLMETIDAVAAEIGMERVGVRISPFGRLYDMRPFDDEAETWVQAAAAFQSRALAYVHLSDQLTIGAEKMPETFAADFCRTYRGTLIAAGGFDRHSGEAALQAGQLDLIAVGRGFIANPDLVERWRHGHPIAEADRATFYGTSGTRGYTDYPVWSADMEAAA